MDCSAIIGSRDPAGNPGERRLDARIEEAPERKHRIQPFFAVLPHFLAVEIHIRREGSGYGAERPDARTGRR